MSYLNLQSGTCKFKVSEAVAKIKAYKVISPRDESALQAAVASQGPVSVAIDASQSSFMSYAGGGFVNVMGKDEAVFSELSP